jgi:hypothetical protein
MDKNTLLKLHLTLKNQYLFSKKLLNTELNTSYLEKLYKKLHDNYYINELNNNLKYILNADNLSEHSVKILEEFFSPNNHNKLKDYLLFLKSVKSFENEISKNLNFINNKPFVDIEDKYKSISLLNNFNEEFNKLISSEIFIKFENSIINQNNFNLEIYKLLKNDSPKEKIVNYILLNNKDNFNNFSENFYSLYDNIIELNSNFMNATDEIFKLLIKSEVYLADLAFSAFISIKNYNDYSYLNQFSKEKIPLDINENIKSLISFNDHSILLEKENNCFDLIYSKKSSLDFKDKLNTIYLREKYQKNPFLCREFIEITKLNKDFNYEETFELFEKYYENQQIFKNFNFNLKKFIKESKNKDYSKTIEDAEDKLTTILIDHSVNNIIKNLSSSKNLHLFNKESYELIKDVLNQKIKIESLNNFIGKKMAKFKNTEDLNKSLKQFINLFGFSYNGIINKANDLNIKIISKENNSVILEIENFEKSSIMGSPSWCISTSETYFKSYVTEDNKQYFIYDFNKENTSNESLIGITLDKEGDFITGHLKDDDYIDENNKILKDFLPILRKSNKIKLKKSINI